MLEVHYTSALNDSDTVSNGANTISITGPNSIDIVNLTTGLVAVKGLTSVRVGGSVPLTDDNKLYDSEFQLQVNRSF